MVKYDSISSQNKINLAFGFDCIKGELNFSCSNTSFSNTKNESMREQAYNFNFLLKFEKLSIGSEGTVGQLNVPAILENGSQVR